MHRMSAKNFKNFSIEKKNPTSSFKIGGILWGKIEIPIGSKHFF